MTFDEWCKSDKVPGIPWVAWQLKVSTQTIYNWRKGKVVPRLLWRREIERLSEGAVPAAEAEWRRDG